MDYTQLIAQVDALTRDVPYETANLANTAAAIWQALDRINWAGFYVLQEDALILGPFQGKPACIRIPMGRGVCGTAAAQGKTQLVADVHAFPGHIACDSASNSEIVVPIFRQGRLWGVLDIDSPYFSRFDETDQRGLEETVRALEKNLFP